MAEGRREKERRGRCDDVGVRTASSQESSKQYGALPCAFAPDSSDAPYIARLTPPQSDSEVPAFHLGLADEERRCKPEQYCFVVS